MRSRQAVLAASGAGCVLAVLLAGCTSAVTGKGSGSSSRPPSSTARTTPTTAGPTGGFVVPTSTPPSTSATSATPPAPASSTPSAGAAFSGFVGTWSGHGRILTVTAGGAVTIVYRTYVTCTAQVTTGCDRISGSTITNGGRVTGHISAVTNATTVRVTVTRTSVPDEIPLGAFTLGHDLTHHALAAFVGDFQDSPFCGPGAASDYCGA